jgi:hypothetical protein
MSRTAKRLLDHAVVDGDREILFQDLIIDEDISLTLF